MKPAARTLYAIKRGQREEGVVAPWHPVIVCASRVVAEWEAGDTTDLACVWSKPNERAVGWLLVRWQGLDIDYGYVVKAVPLPDGSSSAFQHEHLGGEPWSLLRGAVWFSSKYRIPEWLVGVIEAPDEFTREAIRRVEGYCDRDDPGRLRPRRAW